MSEYLADENDAEGARTIASRTAVGEKAAFLNQFPWITEYMYEHEISIPLRTLMCIDLPRVEYGKKKVTKKDKDKLKKENDEIAERFRNKMAAKKDAEN